MLWGCSDEEDPSYPSVREVCESLADPLCELAIACGATTESPAECRRGQVDLCCEASGVSGSDCFHLDSSVEYYELNACVYDLENAQCNSPITAACRPFFNE